MEGALVTALDSSWASCIQGLHKNGEDKFQAIFSSYFIV